MDFDFKIRGADEMMKAFIGMDASTTDEIEREFQRTAKKIEADAKRVLNKPGGVKTGTMRRSITSKVTRWGNAKIEARIGTNLYYAKWQEFGTTGKRKAHTRAAGARQVYKTTKTGKQRKVPESRFVSGSEVSERKAGPGGIPPLLFLTKAYTANRDEFIRRLKDIISSLKL